MAIMVLGGAGYIGSHMVDWLLDYGEEPVVVDNLVTGHRAAVNPKANAARLQGKPGRGCCYPLCRLLTGW